MARLIPWISASRLSDVISDFKALMGELRRLSPPSDNHNALADAIHGVGVAIVSAMAGTGASWFLFFRGAPIGKYFMFVHTAAANLMWAYLVAHASAACVHYMLGSDIFSRMFWFRRSRETSGDAT